MPETVFIVSKHLLPHASRGWEIQEHGRDIWCQAIEHTGAEGRGGAEQGSMELALITRPDHEFIPEGGALVAQSLLKAFGTVTVALDFN
jgi:hypothetical protein